MAVATLACEPARTTAQVAPLTVSDRQFAVNGRPKFLLGVSVFDAIGPTPPRDADLDAFQRWGVGIVRVWAHWNTPIYDARGALTPDGRGRLASLVGRLRARRLVLELVLLRPGEMPGQKFALFASEAARLRAVQDVTRALAHDRDVLFDLYNEHDHPDGPISHATARALRDAVKAIDPQRLVTMSSTSSHLVTPDGHVGAAEARNLREEVVEVGLDAVAPHLTRTADWAEATGPRVAALRQALDRLGRDVPIYLNEENRSNADASLPADAYVRAAGAARKSGAAGWVFHTAAGFSLGGKPFLEALVPDERTALGQVGRFR